MLGALTRREPLGLQVLDTVEGDVDVLRAAMAMVESLDARAEHRPPAAQGLAGGGAAIVPLLCEALAAPKLGRVEGTAWGDALAWVRDPSAATTLVSLTGRTSTALVGAAVRALAALGEAGRDAVEEGARSRKKAVRSSCAWLRVLLDAPEAGALRAVRDAHACLRDDPCARLAAGLDDAAALEETLRETGAAGIVEVIERNARRRPEGVLPGVGALRGDPALPWALAWTLATRPLSPHHAGQVGRALAQTGSASEAPLALLRARPEALRDHGIPYELWRDPR